MGEHGLIIRAITPVGSTAAGDIGRQRHVAALGERLVEYGAMKGESKCHLAAIAFRLDCGVELIEKTNVAFAAEAHDVARLEALCRAHEGIPARAIEPLDQCRFDLGLMLAAAQPPAMEARSDDFGVIDDQRVSCP